MNEHAVELGFQASRSHIALDVFALGVQLAAHGEHFRREIHESHLELPFEA